MWWTWSTTLAEPVIPGRENHTLLYDMQKQAHHWDWTCITIRSSLSWFITLWEKTAKTLHIPTFHVITKGKPKPVFHNLLHSDKSFLIQVFLAIHTKTEYNPSHWHSCVRNHLRWILPFHKEVLQSCAAAGNQQLSPRIQCPSISFSALKGKIKTFLA